MTNEQAEDIVDYIHAIGNVDVEFYESYSGRAMYGQEVGAITIDSSESLMTAGHAIGRAIDDLGLDCKIPTRSDSLGYDTIVY